MSPTSSGPPPAVLNQGSCASIALSAAWRCVLSAAAPPTGAYVRGRRAASGRRDQDGGCLFRVCAVKRRRFPAGASPARRPLQPEATGAGMEVTKCLKPSGTRSIDRVHGCCSVDERGGLPRSPTSQNRDCNGPPRRGRSAYRASGLVRRPAADVRRRLLSGQPARPRHRIQPSSRPVEEAAAATSLDVRFLAT
jgi:hypothetical protein